MWSERRRLVAILAASLLLNVFLAGVLAGRGFFVHHAPVAAPPSGPLVPGRLVETLPDDQKAMFRSAMVAHRPAVRAARKAHRAAREKIEADIAAPVFDRATIMADFEALHATNREIDAAAGAALVDALSGLPQASRAALVGHTPAGPAAAPGQAP